MDDIHSPRRRRNQPEMDQLVREFWDSGLNERSLPRPPVLHPGQPGRVAALELDAAGGLSPDCASER